MTVCACTKCGRVDDVNYGEDAVLGRVSIGCQCGGDFLPATADYVYAKYELEKDAHFSLRMDFADEVENSAKHQHCDICKQRIDKWMAIARAYYNRSEHGDYCGCFCCNDFRNTIENGKI
jgi:hypothetical protein